MKNVPGRSAAVGGGGGLPCAACGRPLLDDGDVIDGDGHPSQPPRAQAGPHRLAGGALAEAGWSGTSTISGWVLPAGRGSCCGSRIERGHRRRRSPAEQTPDALGSAGEAIRSCCEMVQAHALNSRIRPWRPDTGSVSLDVETFSTGPSVLRSGSARVGRCSASADRERRCASQWRTELLVRRACPISSVSSASVVT